MSSSLIGEPTEVETIVNDVPCSALLDTGSQISTLSESFCSQLGLSIQPLDDLLKVEGAGGQPVLYKGWVAADVKFPGIAVQDTNAMFLVVPDTDYNIRVPVLVGTNLLSFVPFDSLDSHTLPPSWNTTKNVMNSIKSMQFNASLRTTKRLIIPPYSSSTLKGRIKSASASVRLMKISVLAERSETLPRSLMFHPAAYSLNPQ